MMRFAVVFAASIAVAAVVSTLALARPMGAPPAESLAPATSADAAPAAVTAPPKAPSQGPSAAPAPPEPSVDWGTEVDQLAGAISAADWLLAGFIGIALLDALVLAAGRKWRWGWAGAGLGHKALVTALGLSLAVAASLAAAPHDTLQAAGAAILGAVLLYVRSLSSMAGAG